MATYDPGIDYSDLIAQEAAKGVNADRQLLAQYEAQRNAKIAGERLPYAQTAVYTSELGRPLGYYGAEDRSDYINEIYDQARELSVAALESAYEREMAGYDYAAAQIPDRYRAAKNALGADAARARQSINEQFAASGLNTGAAGQARLSMAVAGQGALAQLDADRASALSELELQRAGASYRTYSEELLAAWGLTLSGAPLAAESTAAGGTGTGRSAARVQEAAEDKPSAAADDAALLRQQLSRIPGLTRENRAAIIRDYYDNGRISREAMAELLREV